MKLPIISAAIFFFLSFSDLKLYAQTPVNTAVSGAVAPIKPANYNTFTYLISGLSTITEADDLELLFKSRPGIIDVETDTFQHSVKISVPLTMSETDLLEVLKYAGKTIIKSPKELSKFY